MFVFGDMRDWLQFGIPAGRRAYLCLFLDNIFLTSRPLNHRTMVFEDRSLCVSTPKSETLLGRVDTFV